MVVLLLVLGGSVSVGGLVVLMRWLDFLDWRRSLVAFRLSLPRGLGADDVAHWLALVNDATHATKFPLLPTPPVAVEIAATSKGITHYVLVPRSMRSGLLSSLRASLPGVRFEEAPDYVAARPRVWWAAEAALTNHRRPLRTELADTASAALLAALQPLHSADLVVVQWLITGAGIPRIVAPARSGTSRDWWWWNGSPTQDSEAVRAERAKQTAPLLRAAVRIGVRSPDKRRRYAAFGRVWATLRTLNASGTGVVRRWWLVPPLAAYRLNKLFLPLLRWPLTLNSLELAGLIGLAVGDKRLPGLPLGSSRQLPPIPGMASTGAVFGVSNYPGMTNRQVAIRTNDRLRHTWVVGPTGSGKSTLLGNLIVQDMEAGDGLVVVDARGDLVPDILRRVPLDRREDVIVIDPSETARPIGFNILRVGSGEQGQERAVDHVLHIFADLYRASWGPRTADILRSGLLTLTRTKALDGSAFTLCELPELLTNTSFRQHVVSQPTVGGPLANFWHWYEGMSERQRAEVIGPALNKLRAFVLSSSLRLLLGQSEGIDLDDVFRKKRIVLVRLSKGTLGTETAQLVGSLLVASVWQVTLGRVRVSAEQRKPAWLYADEFQETVRLPIDLADMLAQARGFGLGLVLAHQHLGQLPEAVKSAVLATARTQVLFQLDYDDARVMEPRFAPLTRDDLTGLGQYEIAVRPCVDGRTAEVVTASTLPFAEAVADADELAVLSRERYGVLRADVEAALLARQDTGLLTMAGRRSRKGRA